MSRDTRTDGDPGKWAVPPQSETVSRDTPRPEEAYDRVMARVNEAQTGSPTAPRERETCPHGEAREGCGACDFADALERGKRRDGSPAPVPPVAEALANLLDRLEALVRAEKTAGGPSAANSPLLAAHDFRCSLDALCAAIRAERDREHQAEIEGLRESTYAKYLEVETLRAEYNTLIAAVREWQEAEKAWLARRPGRFPWSEETVAACDRANVTFDALLTFPLPTPTPGGTDR